MPDRTLARDREPIENPRTRGRVRAEALRALIGDAQVVYAVRLTDGTIKIGCTGQLWQRRKHWRDSEILAFQFGDFDDEQAIHDQLIEHRARGREYYHPTREVLAAVNRMRTEFGLPELAA